MEYGILLTASFDPPPVPGISPLTTQRGVLLWRTYIAAHECTGVTEAMCREESQLSPGGSLALHENAGVAYLFRPDPFAIHHCHHLPRLNPAVRNFEGYEGDIGEKLRWVYNHDQSGSLAVNGFQGSRRDSSLTTLTKMASLLAQFLVVSSLGVSIGSGSVKALVANQTQGCRNLPGDAAWLDETIWSQLNATLDGQLIDTTPQADVCHMAPYNAYDAAACVELQSAWTGACTRLRAEACRIPESLFPEPILRPVPS